MNNSLAKEFDLKSLLRFSAPSIAMMVFTSLYTIVDGIFVSNLVGTDALSAINICYPLLSLFYAISIMFSTGGCAVVSIQLGEGNSKKANRLFAFITLSALVVTAALAVVSFIFLEPLLTFLGCSETLMPLCKSYLSVLLVFSPVLTLQILFQSFFVAAGKPALGLILTVSAGISNMILDYVFMAHFNSGISGAALATAAGYFIPAIGGVIFFFKNRNGLCFSLPQADFKSLFKSCTNGSSEMVTNLSTSITTMLFNITMMKHLGNDGVAAITAVLYSQFLLTALYLGFSVGVAPILSYHYGAGNCAYLNKLKRICYKFVLATSVLSFVLAFSMSNPLASLFSENNQNVHELIKHGMMLFSVGFIFSGFNIFTSAFFTALSDGLTSAIVSFSRTFLFIIAGLYLMMAILGIDGLWLSIPFAELCAFIISIIFLKAKQKTMFEK